MPTLNPCQSYRQITTLTASPGQIVLMLYDGALRSLERSLAGFDYTDPAEANMTIHNNIQRALDIIRELDGALNLDQGGEFAGTMRRLYDYFDRRLRESNIRKDPAGVKEIIQHLTELRDAWAAMLQNECATLGATPSLPVACAVA
jgi:flagellar secretion chaperone FliS